LSRGASVTSGIELLVFQSAHAFKKWTGIEADIDLIRESAEEYLEI
jgi:shikimate 5-dehydrogenase